MTVYM